MPQFRASQTPPDDETKLLMLLQAQYTYKRMSMARSCSVHILALVSVLVWLVAYWPAFFPAHMYAFTGALWGVVLFLVIVISAEEWKWYRRRARYLAEKYDERAGVKVHL
jgi:uncharacterized membrane protein (DUF485 family)